MIYEVWSSIDEFLRFESEFKSEKEAVEFAKEYKKNNKCDYMRIKVIGKEEVIYVG